MGESDKITVTTPLLPPLEELIPYLQQIWESKWVTNNGKFHGELEVALKKYLGVQNVTLFTNSTIQLIIALRALKVTGEVITTPFSFIATANSILWNGLKPVFVDVDPVVGNMDPDKIEAAITPETTAIMPVHLYGYPCDTTKIGEISQKHNLKVIYDAAHMFGVKVKGKSVLEEGDMSSVSFHATKVFNTLEGGALVCGNHENKKRIDILNNYGFISENQIIDPGINSKMDEVRAVIGLINLKNVDSAITTRGFVASIYRVLFNGIPGIRYLDDIPGIQHNYCYFPVFIDKEQYGRSRDELHNLLINNGILARKYFYPLLSNFDPYNKILSANPENLPIANKLAESVICLPIHHEMGEEEITKVAMIVREGR